MLQPNDHELTNDIGNVQTNAVIKILEDTLDEVVFLVDLVEFSGDKSSDLIASNDIARLDKDILVGLNSMRKEAPHEDIIL